MVETDIPLGLRFSTEVDAETLKKETERKLQMVWTPEVAKEIDQIVATYGSVTTRKTFSGQLDTSDFD